MCKPGLGRSGIVIGCVSIDALEGVTMLNSAERLLAVVVVIVASSCLVWAGPDSLREVTCTFGDGHGMRVQYLPTPYKVKKGDVWTPGNQAAALFLDTSVSIENVTLPAAAYGLYVLPEKHDWKLIVNRTAGRATEYASKTDIVRATMGSSDLGHKVSAPQLVLVHISPTQCNLRVYADSTLAWEEIKEKK